jgi:hypothetical protein
MAHVQNFEVLLTKYVSSSNFINHYPYDQTQVGLIGILLLGIILTWFAPFSERQSPL